VKRTDSVIGAVTAISLLFATAACSNMSQQEQRALSGGAIGAGAGVALGWITGANPLVTGALGAAGGAAVGALTTKK
jgi:hypothetical protein